MTAQLNRLKQDIVELDQYIKKLEKRGKKDLVPKILRKREYLKKHLTEKLQVIQ